MTQHGHTHDTSYFTTHVSNPNWFLRGGRRAPSSFFPGWLRATNAPDKESNPCQLCRVLEGHVFRLYSLHTSAFQDCFALFCLAFFCSVNSSISVSSALSTMSIRKFLCLKMG